MQLAIRQTLASAILTVDRLHILTGFPRQLLLENLIMLHVAGLMNCTAGVWRWVS